MIPSVLLAESFQLRSLCSSHKIIFLFEYMNFLKLVQAVPFWIGCMHWSVQKNLDTSLHGYIYIYIYIYIYTYIQIYQQPEVMTSKTTTMTQIVGMGFLPPPPPIFYEDPLCLPFPHPHPPQPPTRMLFLFSCFLG